MQVKAEPVGDLALISRLIQATNLSNRVEEHYPSHHLWQGPGVGKTLKALLMYILSQNDHRLYRVEDWASNLEQSLRWLLEEPDFQAAHLSDDRLGNLLDYLSRTPSDWIRFQRAHNRALIRFYELESQVDDARLETVRIDSTTAQSHRAAEGLFQMGHNALGLALPQVKLMLLAMDKANLPLAMNAVAGKNSDDKLYIPALELAWQQGLKPRGVLVVGDRKLCNQTNSCFIADSGNYYLGPLAQRQYSPADLAQARQWIEHQAEPAEEGLRRAAGAKQAQPIALVKELPGRQLDSTQGGSHSQRLLAVCSLNLRQRQLSRLEQRIEQARQKITQRFVRSRGRKTLNTVEQAESQIKKILDENKVTQLFSWQIEPPQDPLQPCQVKLILDTRELELEKQLAGWRVMATNARADKLSAKDAVLCYWEEYRIEQHFHLLLNKCTALRPIFLKKENRIQAMLQLLILALQYYNLWQYALRQQLAQQEQDFLTNLVPGNPGRKVHRPTTSLILGAFKQVQIIYLSTAQGTPVAHLQGVQEHHLRLLRLLRLPQDIYQHPLGQ